MIHALLVSVVLTTQAEPLHAALHPAEADVFVELGDVSSLLSALDSAPLLRLLRDERLKGLTSELGLTPERPLRELVVQELGALRPEITTGGWLEGLRTVSASFVGLGPGTDEAAPFAFLGVADLATPEQAAALRSAILASVEKHEPIASDALPGLERLHMTDKPAGDLWCAAIGPRVVVGGSQTKVEDYLGRAEKKLPGLAGRESFKKGFSALDKASGTPVLWLALTRSIQDILAVVQGPEDEGVRWLSQLPVDINPLGASFLARMQLLGERFVTELISNDLEEASAAKPVEPSWLEPAPASSMVVYSSAFDGAAFGKRMRELLAKDEQSAASLAALEQKLGFGPERVLARLGPGMTVYAAAPAGLGLPETRAWIECADPAAFTSEYEALIGALGETLPGFQVKTKPYKVKKSGSEEKVEVPVTTLSLPPDMIQIPMISLSPSFAPVGNRLVFGLSSMDVKNELKRVHAGDGPPIAGTDPLAELGFKLPAGARSVFVMDWGKLLASIIGMIKAIAPMVGPEGMPFDVNKLPPAELFTQYFKPTFHHTRSIPGALYRRNEASFGPETWFGLMGASARIEARQKRAPAEKPSPEPVGGGR